MNSHDRSEEPSTTTDRLSRCRTLEGLSLARPLRPQDVLFDKAVLGYRDRFPSLV